MQAGLTLADRVAETSTTSGTGNFTLSGALNVNRITFNAAFGTNVPFYYVIENTAGEYEIGLGYLSGATTLARSQVIKSSNSDALVSWGSELKTVFADVPAYVLRQLCSRGCSEASKVGFASSG